MLDQLEEGGDCLVGLAVNVEPAVRPPVEQIDHPRDWFQVVDPQLGDLCPSQVGDVCVDATCPLQVRVVERNEDTIGAAVDVSFEIPVPQGDGVLEGGQCVLGRLQVATAMRERDRTFVIEIRVAAHAQIARPAAFQYSSLDNVVGVAVILYDHICDHSRMAMPPTFS